MASIRAKLTTAYALALVATVTAFGAALWVGRGASMYRELQHYVFSDVVTTPPSAKLDQALRIVRSALAALEQDPKQALRSLDAQVIDLKALAQAMNDKKLYTASALLGQQLNECHQNGELDRFKLEAAARPLLEYLPPAWAA